MIDAFRREQQLGPSTWPWGTRPGFFGDYPQDSAWDSSGAETRGGGDRLRARPLGGACVGAAVRGHRVAPQEVRVFSGIIGGLSYP